MYLDKVMLLCVEETWGRAFENEIFFHWTNMVVVRRCVAASKVDNLHFIKAIINKHI
jgi:hypothetical protein